MPQIDPPSSPIIDAMALAWRSKKGEKEVTTTLTHQSYKKPSLTLDFLRTCLGLRVVSRGNQSSVEVQPITEFTHTN
jgi:hypothetical protein